MPHTIHIKQRSAAHVATRRRHTSLNELPSTFRRSLDDILAWVTAQGSVPSGRPFAIYHNVPFNPQDIDVELGIEVEPEPHPRNANGVHVHDLPEARVACVVHTGPYSELGAAYDDAFRWVHEHGYRVAGPPREVYLKGPNEARDPSELVTEIEVPIA